MSTAAGERAQRYHRLGRRFWAAGTTLEMALPLAFWLSGLSGRLAFLTTRIGSRWLDLALYLVVVGVGYAILTAPLTLLRGYVVPRRYGLLRQPLRGWLGDAAKGAALGGAFGLVALEFVYWTFTAFPRWWWLVCGVAALLVSLFVGLAAPVLLAPLFFRFKPLQRAHILARIQGLLERSGLQARGVYEFDLSRKYAAANAAVFGFGPTRRIVLADTLLDSYTAAEVEAVVAHELGHHAHRDLWIGVASGGLVTLFSLLVVALLFSPGLLGTAVPLTDLAGFPLWLLAFELAALALNPVALAVSRWSERRADSFARAAASEPGALSTALARLGQESLADPAPPRWEVLIRYSHPPMHERGVRG